jgi:hypothetical protein
MSKDRRICLNSDCNSQFEAYPSSLKKYCSPKCRYSDENLLHKVGRKTDHILKNIDSESMTAECSECGPTYIRKRTVTYKYAKRVRYRCGAYERDRKRKKLFQISSDQLLKKLADQNFRCSICLSTIDLDSCRIDHDHSCCPGRETCGHCVRGVLCSKCNVVLGALEDNVDAFERAIIYLKAWHH